MRLRSKPTPFKSSVAQAFNDVRTLPHQSPQKSRAIVFNHRDDWSLIKSVIAKRNPSLLLCFRIRKRRIVATLETILAGHLRKLLVEVMKRWQHNLRRKRQRCDHRPGSKCAIIRSKGNAPPFVIVKAYRSAFDVASRGSRPVAGRDSPNMFAISLKLFWILNRVLPLCVSRSTCVLEIINRLAFHVVILNAAKVDPHVRELMNKKRASIKVLEPVEIFPLVSPRPSTITLWRNWECRRRQRQNVKNQSFAIACPAILDESGFGFPSVRDGQCAMLCPSPVGAAIEFFCQIANLPFFVVISIKILSRR